MYSIKTLVPGLLFLAAAVQKVSGEPMVNIYITGDTKLIGCQQDDFDSQKPPTDSSSSLALTKEYELVEPGKVWEFSVCGWANQPDIPYTEPTVEDCLKSCNRNRPYGCTAINYRSSDNTCTLRKCTVPAPEPTESKPGFVGYSLKVPKVEGDGSCPESPGVTADGFIKVNGSDQCFRLYEKPHRTWEDAKAWCASQGMALAAPQEDITWDLLMAYMGLMCTRNSCRDEHVWLGARGTGQASKGMEWVREDTGLGDPGLSKLWVPAGSIYRKCLGMKVWNGFYRQPYSAYDCSEETPTLCEVLRG